MLAFSKKSAIMYTDKEINLLLQRCICTEEDIQLKNDEKLIYVCYLSTEDEQIGFYSCKIKHRDGDIISDSHCVMLM